ncbi:chloride channel protein [Psychrobium sp. 1_MG-2023]|uniref:chloride channel protein n=1 Tax=Psychrobium sp. 1_MG-2023 TaxID=3062624 RepID=UPI000C33D763|nr:chloride channel protein [Psychrobium sp. 1_MG-2023]MDP2559599.1 chloride channel protein [Psychrobium sp. 1_MG-2023]PKF59433.1 hypothetical protein CW748_01285 [Alteromonadales bacterium alter-6D02]
MNMIHRFKYPLAQAKTSWQLVLLGAIVGLLASLAIIALRLGIEAAQTFYMGSADAFEEQSTLTRFIAPFCGVLLILLIGYLSGHRHFRMGIPFVLHRQRKHYGFIPIGNTINQFFSAITAIASGFSVGREGPAVHVGAGSASYLAQKLYLPKNTGRILTSCGIAAGISASFNSPLAAVVFVLEVVVQRYRIHLFLPIMVAALIGTAMTRMVFGNVHQYSNLSIPDISTLSVIPFLGLGILIGLAAVAFNRSLLGIAKHSSVLSINVRLPLAALIAGTIGWFIPQTMGSDLGALTIALSDSPEITFLIMVLIGKFIATVCSLGLGIPGGVIGVLYAIGALLGSVIVWLFIPLFPQLTPYIPMAVLICMVAMMGTSLNAPLASVVAVLEFSENATIIFPSLLVMVPAIILSQQVFRLKSLFYQQLDQQKLGYKVSPVIYSLQDTGVTALMRRKFDVVHHGIDTLKQTTSIPLVMRQYHQEKCRYYLAEKSSNSHEVTPHLLPTLIETATLAEVYRLLSPQRFGHVLILSHSDKEPVGIISWRTLRKHLHRKQGA